MGCRAAEPITGLNPGVTQKARASRPLHFTGVENRLCLERLLENAAFAAHHSVGVFRLPYVDLNDVKQVNVGYGHRTGDPCL